MSNPEINWCIVFYEGNLQMMRVVFRVWMNQGFHAKK